MKFKKGIISVVLCLSILLTSIVPSFSLGDDVQSETSFSTRIVASASETYDEEESGSQNYEEPEEDETTETSETIETSETSETSEEGETTEETETSETIESSESSETSETTETTETIETTESTMIDVTTTALEEGRTATLSELKNIASEEAMSSNVVIATLSEVIVLNATESEVIEIKVASASVIALENVFGNPIATTSTATESEVKKNPYSLGTIPSGYVAPRVTTINGNRKLLRANLPSSFDARTESTAGVPWVPAIRNQGGYGVCWAFATIGATETSLRKKGLLANNENLSVPVLSYFSFNLDEVTDYDSGDIDKPGLEGHDRSYVNTDYFIHKVPPEPNKATWSQCGGDYMNATRTMSAYMGLVKEVDGIRYDDMDDICQDGIINQYAFKKNDFVLNYAQYINKDDIDLIKEAIMKHGSVAISYCVEDDVNKSSHQFAGSWYYCSNHDVTYANHSIMVVGWDDDIGKECFYYDNPASCSIPNDGAWLCRNSWGDYNESNDGYFWMSYYETSLDPNFCAIDAVPASEYKYNYHYDTTWDMSYIRFTNFSSSGNKFANIFKVSDDEDQILDAVSLGLDSTNATYDIMVYTSPDEMETPIDGTLQSTQRASSTNAGFYTVVLDDCVGLEKGTYFSIVIKPISTSDGNFIIYADMSEQRADVYWNGFNEAQLNQTFTAVVENGKEYWDDINTNSSGQSTLGPGPNDEYYGMNYRIKGMSNPGLRISFNSGDGKSYNQIVRSGVEAELFENEFGKANYKFVAWEDQNGKVYQDKEKVTITENLILTAQWEYIGGGSDSGSSSSSGGGSGRGPIPQTPQSNATTTEVNSLKAIAATVNGDISTWSYDPLTNSWRLNAVNANGQLSPLSNGFYLVNRTVSVIVNGNAMSNIVNNTYYFDQSGNMVTGWVKTADNNWYFFENAKTADEGKMVLGWKSISGSWYYFNADGSMMKNGITPDGYNIGSDGRWV